MGLTGVLPIMTSRKQSGFYILPALPFFAVGLAIFITEQSEKLTNKIKSGTRFHRYFNMVSVLVLLAGLVAIFYNKNKFSRDEVKLKDTYAIIPSIPAGSVISIHPGMWEDGSLHGYYFRLKNISLDPDQINLKKFLLIRNELLTDTTLLTNYIKADIQTSEYKLYKRK